jgi:hypothetical protein
MVVTSGDQREFGGALLYGSLEPAQLFPHPLDQLSHPA